MQTSYIHTKHLNHNLFTSTFQVSLVRAKLEEVESEALAAKEEAATLREVRGGSRNQFDFGTFAGEGRGCER